MAKQQQPKLPPRDRVDGNPWILGRNPELQISRRLAPENTEPFESKTSFTFFQSRTPSLWRTQSATSTVSFAQIRQRQFKKQFEALQEQATDVTQKVAQGKVVDTNQLRELNGAIELLFHKQLKDPVLRPEDPRLKYDQQQLKQFQELLEIELRRQLGLSAPRPQAW